MKRNADGLMIFGAFVTWLTSAITRFFERHFG